MFSYRSPCRIIFYTVVRIFRPVLSVGKEVFAAAPLRVKADFKRLRVFLPFRAFEYSCRLWFFLLGEENKARLARRKFKLQADAAIRLFKLANIRVFPVTASNHCGDVPAVRNENSVVSVLSVRLTTRTDRLRAIVAGSISSAPYLFHGHPNENQSKPD